MRAVGLASAQRAGVGTLALALVVAQGCAQIAEVRSLHVVPLEAARAVVEQRGEGYRIKGARDGAVVRLVVVAVERCVDVRLQRADGFERVERRASGPTLKMQWAMGGLFSAAAAVIATYATAHPAPPAAEGELTATASNRSAYLQAGVFGAVGVGLLVASAVQQASLGRVDKPLGTRELRREGRLRTCGQRPAVSGRVRLTLADGHQIEADVGAGGEVIVPLPDDVDARLAREGHGATVEVLGDWRSQARIQL